MDRVLIFGGPGGGKTTLAVRLAEKTGLPLVHMDAMLFAPDWQARDADAIYADVHNAAINDRWIIEGNHPPSLAPRIARADCIVYLDTPLRIRFPRVVKRMWRSLGKTRPDLSKGCRDKLSLKFLARVLWGYGISRRKRLLLCQSANAPAGTPVYILKTQADVERFIRNGGKHDETENRTGTGVGRCARLEPHRRYSRA